MWRVTLRSLWEHKRRLVSTVLAIVLGVAFMSGTFVFADTIDKVFADLFGETALSDPRFAGQEPDRATAVSDGLEGFGETVDFAITSDDG